MKMAIYRINYHTFHIIDKHSNLCRTKDTPIKTFKNFMIMEIFIRRTFYILRKSI